jgi:hypothetical protein
MKKQIEANDNAAQDQPGDKPNRRDVQGKALQMNDNSVGGKKPASPEPPPDAGKLSPHEGQGKALQINENSVGE